MSVASANFAFLAVHGELPNDEPARVLLERIRAEREACAIHPSKRGRT